MKYMNDSKGKKNWFVEVQTERRLDGREGSILRPLNLGKSKECQNEIKKFLKLIKKHKCFEDKDRNFSRLDETILEGFSSLSEEKDVDCPQCIQTILTAVGISDICSDCNYNVDKQRWHQPRNV